MRSSKNSDPQRLLERHEKLGHVANDVIDASVGALAGGAMGVLAGPPGILVGAAAGALAGGLLGHQADIERQEREVHDREVDDIDAEEEFFGQARALGLVASQTPAATQLRALVRLRREHRIIERVLDAFERWA